MGQEALNSNGKRYEFFSYRRTKMQKEIILQKLKEQGLRITRQRVMLLDIILEEECSCCKEIYYRASKVDPKIGSATVYRMINTLETIGAIDRKNMYKIACGADCEVEEVCTVELDNGIVLHLSATNWNAVIMAGLKAQGYLQEEKIKCIEVQSCSCRGV